MDSEQAGHLTAGAGLRGREAREGLPALVSLGLSLGAQERLQCLWRVVDGRKGRVQDQRLRSDIMSARYRS